MLMTEQSVGALVAQGLALHQQGNLPAAEQVYRAILIREPQNGDALHLLGALRGRQGMNEDGIRLIEAAIAVNPRVSAYYNNLGNLKIKAGDVSGAEEGYRQAIRVDRGNADALLNLGKLLEGRGLRAKARESYISSLRRKPRSVEGHMSLGRLEEADGKAKAALQSYINAVRLEPKFAAGHLAVGNAQLKLEQLEKAEESYRTAVALEPSFADGYFNLANTLRAQGKADEAVAMYERAIELSPLPDADVYDKYGVALSDVKRHEDAIVAHRRAIALRPELVEAHFNLGRELTTTGDLDGGIAKLHETLALDPEYAQAYVQLGVALYAKGFLHDAIAANRRALAFDPSCPVVRRNLGMALSHTGDVSGLEMLAETVREVPDSPDLRWNYAEELLLHGRFEEGWPEYEWRMQVPELMSQYRGVDVPRWKGEDVAGKRVLVYAEQGFGDTLQFARYARLLEERGAAVILEVHSAVQRWCAALPGVAECHAQGTELPQFDVAVSMMSLPYLLGTRAETIPPPVAAQVEGRRRASDKLQVGIVWAGNGKHVRDRLRSTRLTEWSGLADIDGVEFTSLQVGGPMDQVAAGGHGFAFVGDCSGTRDFADTAEIIAGLDLVIAVDTAVAHLAGSMGKPVWILLYNAVDWRWGLERTDSAWYPTARLFRQRRPAEWGEVFAEVEGALREMVGKCQPQLQL